MNADSLSHVGDVKVDISTTNHTEGVSRESFPHRVLAGVVGERGKHQMVAAQWDSDFSWQMGNADRIFR